MRAATCDGSDQRAGRYRLQRMVAPADSRMRGRCAAIGAGDAPGGSEGKRQQDHGAVERDMRLDRRRQRPPLRPVTRGSISQVDRQADQDARRGPGKAGVAPADGFQPPGG